MAIAHNSRKQAFIKPMFISDQCLYEPVWSNSFWPKTHFAKTRWLAGHL